MEIMKDQTCMDGGVTPFPDDPVVAMAYIPFQQFNTVYPPEKGLDSGTIFPELDKPFYGSRGVGR